MGGDNMQPSLDFSRGGLRGVFSFTSLSVCIEIPL